MRPESMHPGHRLSWQAIVVLALVPLVAVAMLLGVSQGGNRPHVQAAVVNLDEAVTIDGQIVPLGRQLAAEMVARTGENITWTLADEADARAGLAEGRYAAVVTIPAQFSAAATSFKDNDADAAKQATVQVDVSANAPVTDADLAREIAGLATNTINATLTEGYLGNVYVGFNTVGKQFTQLVDGVSRLDEGGKGLADGAGQAVTGSEQLETGLNTLVDKGGELTEGADGLADGASQVADGTGTLAKGAKELSDGAGGLAGGAGDLADGSTALASGANQFDQGIQQLNAQAPKLVEGVNTLVEGSEQVLGAVPDYTAGTGAVVDGVGALRDGLVSLDDALQGSLDPETLARLQSSMDELVPALKEARTALQVYFPDRDPASITHEELEAAAKSFDKALTGVETTIDALAEGTAPASPEVEELARRIIAEWRCPVDDPELCEQLGKVYAQGVIDGMAKGVQHGAAVVREKLHTTDQRTGMTPLESARAFSRMALRIAKPVISIRDLAKGNLPEGTDPLDLLQQLPTTVGEKVGQLVDGVKRLRSGADELATRAAPLKENGPALGEGATALLEGTRSLGEQVGALPEGTRKLADASGQLSDGANAVADGAGALADGAGQLADGAGQLSQGAGALATGGEQLASGADQLAAGAERYVGGVGQAAEGMTTLRQGLIRLSDGATAVSSGVSMLHDELGAAKDKLPHYSAEDIETLSRTVASPVERSDEVGAPAMAPIAALLAVATLWLGALLAYAFATPVPSDVVTESRSSLRLWLRTVGLPGLIGAGQGVLIGVIAGVALNLSLPRTAVAMGLLAVVGVSFVLINHALTAWFGTIGRGLAVLLLVATVGLGLTSTVPGWVAQVAAFSPLHNALLLVRTWLAHGSGLVLLAGGALLFGVIALACSYAGIAARRRLTAEQFRARVAEAS
ncbi:MAG: hypothetical protein Q4D89_06110 [Arachnia propionica]|uniref:hypothetical protein n=1 Tax=Arachnia propionica TaxID=1750 RepID=UPI002700DE1D|nr:hypothetical protein [Arachnia propionica]